MRARQMIMFIKFATLAIFSVIFFHFLYIYIDEGFPPSTQSLTSPSWIKWSSGGPTANSKPGSQPSKDITTIESNRTNAALVMLARNLEVEEVISSMLQLEERFNWKFGYPWVFLNDVPFSEEFMSRTRAVTSSNVSYGVVPSSHWNMPSWIDHDRAMIGQASLVAEGVKYANSTSYRNMCRFYSGFFFKHPLLSPYKYYWRVEPNVQYFCDINYDPFLLLQETGKVYGFTLSLYDWPQSVATLWDTVKEFLQDYPQYLVPGNSSYFLSDDDGNSYNYCHFWSNFEIGDMDFWRGEAYQTFFNHLDSRGGFYYERWGDAPIHSIAAILFAGAGKIHFFDDIGYQHDNVVHCPTGKKHRTGNCRCRAWSNFDYNRYSCLRRFEKVT